ncbi:Ig-like domain-containing protein [Gammaproteobacteria bacterium]|nr:Ig-like domain-containing protein [Gammaproteobacteria bacterium]
MNKKLLPITFSILFIVSCGGGGGGGGSTPTPPTTPAPTVNLSAEPTSVLLESTSTLTWSSSNATSCSASWTTQTGTSGSEAVTITAAGNNSFSISCSGDGGSRSASVTVEGYRETDGVVVDGYISGAEVFIDEDDDWVLDSNENSTTSDNEGKFTIRYANGNLVSIGGTDLDSQTLLDNLLITHKLTGHSDFKAVTPVTSVAAFMEDASLVNAALGIYSSIDVFTFDPVANKGDGGIYDYLYEKGNQLTVLAFALQNITNDLNTTTETTQDYFKAITEEIEKEYTETETKVDIETETFISKALDNVIVAKSVTIDETAKVNVTKALSGMLPIIQVKSSDDLTTSVIRFAVSTLQTDIQAIANGTATAETVTSYTEDLLTYIAEDQNVDSGEIAPDISAINDSASTTEDTALEINVLLNDSYVTASPFSLSATNGTNGSTSISNNLITYSPDADYNGSDSFSYTITQGDKTSSADVTLTIEAVNDAPSIDIALTIQVAENQTAVTTVSVSDVDEDELTLTLGGTDADSFNLSDENVLTFKEAPDYETKDSYSITLTLTDGTEIVTKDVTIAIIDINNVPDSFKGEVIDGYISGAEIFIDQNFNFNMDDGEYSATTASDGSFNIDLGDEDIYKCLEKRPIIANVPVGAIDSSLGEISQAYQMVLPSISDTGSTSIVISPFTSLFAEAILSSKSNIAQDLTVSEGCESDGDNIAANISTRIDELKASIESNFGISYDQLLSDFIENPTNDVDETSAQNIAKLFPYLQIIDNQVSDYLTESFNKNIRANVSLSEDSLSIIFSGSNYEKLPLDFYSNYQTNPNSDGWYRSEYLDASGAFISKNGVLSREDCSEADTTLCDITELSLNNIANTSTSYTKTSNFSKSTPVDFNELGITNGSLSVSSTISSSWRNNSENWNQPNNRSRECQKTESIYFSTGNTDTDQYTTHFFYNNYSQGFEKADCNNVRHYYTPILNASTFLTNNSGSALGAQYYIFDVLRSGISSNLPYDFVDDGVDINPELVVKDIAVLPRMYKDLDTIRALFRGDDYVLFNYDRNSASSAYFEAGTNPSNDMFWDRESESSRIYGQAARTAFFNKLKEDTNLNEDFYGESAPTNTSVIGRIANSYIEITDYNESEEIILQVTPTYDYQTQTLDYSVESSLDLDNIKDFIKNGINGNPLNAKIWYNPDGSIASTVPIKLYLYEGDDSSIDANEAYFEMSFNLNVSSSSSGNTNSYEATQVWTFEENSEISVSYTEDGVTLSQTVINIDEDKITLVDSNTGDTADSLDSYINQPSNLNLKLLNLISKVSDKISGIQNFFEDGGKYTIELDLGSGGHSLVAFDRNIVKNITGTFTTKSSPTYAISVNDMIINEGDSKDICFSRSSNGDMTATEFELSFTQRERPGKGGLADDFTLSDTTIIFDENATQSCTVFSAIKDTHFDWAHDIYLDISEPSNGQSISRPRMKITILDIYFPNRIDWRRK